MGEVKERYTLEDAAKIIAQSDAAGINQILQKLRQSVGDGELKAYLHGSHSPFVFDDDFVRSRLNKREEEWKRAKRESVLNSCVLLAGEFTSSEQRRRAEIMIANVQATVDASGGGTVDPSVMRLMLGLKEEGELAALDIKFDAQPRYSVFPNNLEVYWDDLNEWLENNMPRIDCEFPKPNATPTAKMEAVPVTSLSCDELKPWLIADPKDPNPKQPWYTPARYFARQLVRDDTTLLMKKKLLADKVAASLADVGVFKRGKIQKKFDGGTVLKAFSNVIF